MTYGELKNFVLQLLNAYSVAGEQVALSYNDQADLVARMPHLTRDALIYLATTVRKLRTVAELTEPQTVGNMLVYELPEDYYQLVGGLVRLDGGRETRYCGYRLVGGRQVQIPREDGERYWVTAGGRAYVWDHGLSTAGRPSWFYFTNIPAVDFFRGDSLPPEGDDGQPFTGPRRIYHLDSQGRISRFARTFRDYGGAIEKVYQFATQSFGTYERLKNIERILIATRSDTDTVIQVCYATDHGQRTDLTPITTRNWRLAPRNLGFRFLGVRKFAHVALRKPRCRHVQHFSLRLENAQAGCDMSVVSAEITARMAARVR